MSEKHHIIPVWFFVGVLLLVYGVIRWSRTDSGADRIDKVRVALPVFGNI